MLRRLCAAVVLVASVPVVLAPPGSAELPSGGISLTGLASGGTASPDLVVDHRHDQLLIAAAGGIDVAVTGATTTAHHVPSPPDVGGIALSTDESALWYTDPVAGQLVSTDEAALDTAVPDARTVPGGECPTRLAVDGADRVWFLYRPCAAPSDPAGLGVYDPATDHFDLQPALDQAVPDLGALDVLDNNPASPDTLVVASDRDTTTIDAATGTVHTDVTAPGGARSVAVTADGSHFIRAGGELAERPTADPGSTTDVAGYDPSPLHALGSAAGVALSADGTHLAGSFGSDIITFGTADGDHGWIRRCETTLSNPTTMVWVGTTVWYVKDNDPTLELWDCVGMTAPQTFITTPAPIAQQGGTTFSAPIRLLYRDEPLADATIAVRRSGAAGAATLPPISTDANGNATLQDTVRRDENSYTLAFADDGSHPGYSTFLNVQGTREATNFVFSGGSRTGRVDQAVSIQNRLTTSAGKGLGHRTLKVVRTDAAGRHRLPDVTTDGTGRFTITDTPRYGPSDTYYVSYLGEAGYQPAPTAKYTATIARLRPDLRIGLRAKAIWYDQSATVRIHLGRTYSRRSVSLIAVPVGGGRHHVLTSTVNRQGNLTANVPMRRNTRFFAEFTGDARYAPRKVSVLELSGLLPKLSISGDYGTSGKYHLYRSGDYVKLTGTLLPARGGRCLRFDSFQRRNGRWVADPSSSCFTTNRHGVARAYFHVAHPRLGVPYAIESFFAGDRDHCRSWSGFTYFEFTAAAARSRASARSAPKGAWTIRA